MKNGGAHDGSGVAVRLFIMALCFVGAIGCECGSESAAPSEPGESPPNFDQAMADHADLSRAAMNALIRGDLPVARQASRKLLFFMQHVPYPEKGQAQARLTQSIATQLQDAEDLEEAAMGFSRLSHACGQCHHAVDGGPPLGLDETPEGDDLPMHMRRHYWAVEKMWEALLSDSPTGFQRGARALAEAPLLGQTEPDAESPAGTTRLAYEVHDLAFAAAVEGDETADDYVPPPGEPREPGPTTLVQAELFGRLLTTCSQCHTLLGVSPALTYDERRQGTP